MRIKSICEKVMTLALGLAFIQSNLAFAGDEFIEIVNPSDGLMFNFYTSDGTPPSSVPVLVEVETGGFDQGVERVEVAVDGELGEGTWTGESLTTATQSGSAPSEWSAVVNLLSGGAFTETRGSLLTDFVDLYAFATAAQYYTRATTTFDAMDEIEIEINVDLLSTIDEDENGLPDADKLSDLVPPGSDQPIILVVTTADGETIIVLLVSIADVVRGGSSTEEEITIDLGSGNSLTATVVSPNLSTLQSDLPGNTDVQTANNAVLAIAVSANAANLVDDGADPVSEFAIDGADTPSGAFVSIDILLENITPGRGVPTTWTALTDTLPTPVEAEIFGTPLMGLTEALAYSYETAFEQSGNALLRNSGGTGWAEYDVADITVTDDSDGFVLVMDELGVIIGFTSDADTGGSGGSCLIANAAFGTPMAEEIQSIRTMRDSFLLNNPLGQALSSTYYKLSAPLSSNATLQTMTKTALKPVILISNLLVAVPLVLPAVGLALAAFFVRRKIMID
jgi:hypothetical protein